MTLGKKLVVAFLACGLVPLTIVAVAGFFNAKKGMSEIGRQGSVDLEGKAYNQLVALRDVKKRQLQKYFADRRGDMEVLVETAQTLRSEAFNKLVAVRQIKRAAVERYFQSINDQILTFSEDRMIVQAMRDYRAAFGKFREQNQVSADTLQQQRAALRTYYTNDFASEYEAQNGQAPPVDQFFNGLDDDSIALQYAFIKNNPNPLGSKHLLDRPADESEYSRVHERVHPIVRNYLEKFGYYDIFLVDPQTGDIVYSVFKELDYSTSLIDGPYANTNFGEAFRQANAAGNRDAVVLVDYKQYPPSYEAPASFIASPVFDGDEKVGVAMFQMPIDRLNAIMTERAGLGETGETYLIGPDLLMRSDSYLDPDGHNVVASFRNPEQGKVDTAAGNRALAGQTGAEVIIDYNGNPVLSAYCPVNVGGITWALMAEIDVAEAFCPHADGSEQDFFTKYKELYGYYDLFLMNPDGFCFYTVCHEADYQTNLVTGPYKDSGLGQVVQQALKTGEFQFADFAPYEPSNGEPAAFIAEPVEHNGQIELVVALQMPLSEINAIMGVRAGMGDTGETYLVGPDKLMRSDSFLDPEGHSVAASFANPQTGQANTDAVNAALNGESGAEVIIDYNGNPVLSAYTPLDVFGTRWALLAEIDEAEAMAAAQQMQDTAAAAGRSTLAWAIGLGLAAAVLVSLVGVWFAATISRPINRIIAGLNEGAERANEASEQVSSTAAELADGSSRQSAALEETSSALEEVASMTRANSGDAQRANELSAKARTAANEGDQTTQRLDAAMVAINESSDKISKIIKVIEEIAFQTNLLALNAAVEAARAGEHGKGFAVVAEEVRNLAMRAANAAGETTTLISDSVERAREGSSVAAEVGKALTAINTDVGEVTDLINRIANASAEQAQGVDQVNKAVLEMEQVTQHNAAGAEECASAAEQMSSQSAEVKRMVDQLVGIVGGQVSTASGVIAQQPAQRARRRLQGAPPQQVAVADSAQSQRATPPQPEEDQTLNNF